MVLLPFKLTHVKEVQIAFLICNAAYNSHWNWENKVLYIQHKFQLLTVDTTSELS